VTARHLYVTRDTSDKLRREAVLAVLEQLRGEVEGLEEELDCNLGKSVVSRTAVLERITAIEKARG
jgi:hypothetical protein